MSTPPPLLDYAPSVGRWHRWRWRIACLVAILVALYCAVRYGGDTLRQAQCVYWQRQCLNYTAAPDQVVYEEEPTAAARLLAGNPLCTRRTSRNPVIAGEPLPPKPAVLRPGCWQSLCDTLTTAGRPTYSPLDAAIVFLHERTAPNGERYLVCVDYYRDGGAFQPVWIAGFNCTPIAVVPGTLTHLPRTVPFGYDIDVISGYPKQPPNTRIYAGQPDPADPSHFTIRYEMWGKEDAIDGRIDNTGHIILQQRHIPDWPR